MGAAVATIAMYFLKAKGYNVLQSYNFESPRAGNAAFANAIGQAMGLAVPMYRITRGCDPVPHVPPRDTPGMDYRHAGAEVYLSGDTEESVVCAVDGENRCSARNNVVKCLISQIKADEHCQ